MPYMQRERNSIQLYHDPQHDSITILGKTLPILIELLPSDNKVSVSVVVLFFWRKPMCDYAHTSTVYTN